MPIESSRNKMPKGFAWAVAISVMFLIVAFVAAALKGKVPNALQTLINQLDLDLEDNVATWWSGALWLVTAFYMLDKYFYFKRLGQTAAARGWLALSGVVIAFSLDELASIHERLPTWLPWGDLAALAPYIVIVGGLSAFSVLAFWLDRSHRRTALWAAFALGIIYSVPVSEEIDLFVDWWGSYMGTRNVLEEGREILGSLILLSLSLEKPTSIRNTGLVPATDSVVSLYKTLLTIGLVAALPFAFLTASLTDVPRRGQPTEWLVSALCLIAALRLINAPRWPSRSTAPYVVLAALACLLSIEAESLNGMFGPRGMLFIFSISYLLFIAVRGFRFSFGASTVMAAAAGIVAMGIAVLSQSLLLICISVSVLGIATLIVSAMPVTLSESAS